MKIAQILFLGIALAFGHVAVAQPQAPISMAFQIEPQPLADALAAFAKQAGLQLIQRDEEVSTEGKTAPRVVGKLTANQALQRLLEGTGLGFEFVNERTVRISKAAEHRTGDIRPGESAVRMADADSTLVPASTEEAGRDASEEPLEEIHPDVPEILVVGSKSLNTDIRRSRDDIQPYTVFDRQRIEQSGARNIDDFLKDQLSMNTTQSSLKQSADSLGGTASSINLRGLGANQTLILLDGHRMASYNVGVAGQPDINGIPMAAIERIEVLPSTASGIHGGSATGGVINIVLRRDYSGVGAGITYGGSFEGGGINRRVDMNAGFDLQQGKTSVLLIGSYADSDPLLVGDRKLAQRGRARIRENDPNTFLAAGAPPVGATTNICSATVFFGYGFCDGAPLMLDTGPSLNASTTFVPRGYAGGDGGAGLIANAGQYNLDLADTAQIVGGGQQALVTTPRIKSISASVRSQLTDRIQGFLDLGASDNDGRAPSSTSWSAASYASAFVIPAGAPNNPFAQDILVSTPLFGADGSYRTSLASRRAVGGLIYRLAEGWQAGLDYTWSRVRFSHASPGQTFTPQADIDIASGAVDLLRDTNMFPVSFAPYLPAYETFGPSNSTLNDITLRIGGPLKWSLPGGAVTVSASASHRREGLGAFVDNIPGVGNSIRTARHQSVNSLYLESQLPVTRKLEVQLAARTDHYENVGGSLTSGSEPGVTASNTLSSIDPTIGLKFSPAPDIALRGSFGTGFLPPELTQFVPDTPSLLSFLGSGVTDPLRGGEELGTILLKTGGNPDLKPSQSKSWSAGVILTPRVLRDLRLSIDWTRISKRDDINLLNAFTQADVEAFINFAPARIERSTDPATFGSFGIGPIIGIDQSFINISRARVEAIDLALDYDWRGTRLGDWHLAALVTRQIHQVTQLTPAADELEQVGVATLRWKGNVSLTWQRALWQAGWTARYFDSYCPFRGCFALPAQGDSHIPSQLYHDLFVRYQFDHAVTDGASSSLGSRLLNGTDIQLSVSNVFNKAPPFVASDPAGYYYSTYGDPLMATYALTIRTRF